MSKRGLYIGGHSREHGNPKTGNLSDPPFEHLKEPLIGPKKAKRAAKLDALAAAEKKAPRKRKLRAWRSPD